MEQAFDSEESSSGCESGWTLYLQHSNIVHHHHDFSCKATHQHIDHDDEDGDNDNDDENDDMSMVSDASSGPPHFQEHDEDEYCNNNDNDNNNNGVFSCDPTLVLGSRKRRKIFKQTSFHSHRHILQDLPDSLDDTASSPFFNFSNKDLKVCNKQALLEDDDDSFSYSQGHSTTYFEMV